MSNKLSDKQIQQIAAAYAAPPIIGNALNKSINAYTNDDWMDEHKWKIYVMIFLAVGTGFYLSFYQDNAAFHLHPLCKDGCRQPWAWSADPARWPCSCPLEILRCICIPKLFCR